MTGPRIPHTRAGVRWTGGDDRPIGACYGLAEKMRPNPTPYDLMLDHKQGTPPYRLAREEAAAICGRCVLDCDVRVEGLKPCGTVAAYRRHLTVGETPCDDCRAAANKVKRDILARKKAAA